MKENDSATPPAHSPSSPYPSHHIRPHDEGIVEVEFFNPFPSELIALAADVLPEGVGGIASLAISVWLSTLDTMGLELRKLAAILRAHGLLGVGYSFGFQMSLSNPRRRFVRFIFPLSEPLLQVCQELISLNSFVKAAVPAATLPPSGHGDDSGAAKKLDPFVPVSDSAGPANQKVHEQWYLAQCNAPAVWKNGITGDGVVVASIDWGVKISHQDIQGRLLDPEHMYNSIDDTTGPGSISRGDGEWHGTAVLGLLGAGLDGSGICGFAPKATLWAVKGGREGPGPDFTEGEANQRKTNSWARAIDWVCERSNGRPERTVILLEAQTAAEGNIETIPCIAEAISDAIDRNVVVCVAAGNAGKDASETDTGEITHHRARSILVGATAYDDAHPDRNPPAPYSNFGDRVVIWAPGDQRYDWTCDGQSSLNSHYTQAFGCTSGASAKVAGAVALMLQANSDLTHDQIREILRSLPSRTTPDEPGRGGAFLDVEQAVAGALGQ